MEENKRDLEANNLLTSRTTCQPSTKTKVTSTTPDYAADLALSKSPTPEPFTRKYISSYIVPATPLSPEHLVKEESASMYIKNTIVFTVGMLKYVLLFYNWHSLKILNLSLKK